MCEGATATSRFWLAICGRALKRPAQGQTPWVPILHDGFKPEEGFDGEGAGFGEFSTHCPKVDC